MDKHQIKNFITKTGNEIFDNYGPKKIIFVLFLWSIPIFFLFFLEVDDWAKKGFLYDFNTLGIVYSLLIFGNAIVYSIDKEYLNVFIACLHSTLLFFVCFFYIFITYNQGI